MEHMRTSLLTAFEKSDGTILTAMVAAVVSKVIKDEQGREQESPLYWYARTGGSYHTMRDTVIRRIAHDGCDLTEPVARAVFPRLANIPYKRLDVVVSTVANNTYSGGPQMHD